LFEAAGPRFAEVATGSEGWELEGDLSCLRVARTVYSIQQAGKRCDDEETALSA
jgi:hypothetical protein